MTSQRRSRRRLLNLKKLGLCSHFYNIIIEDSFIKTLHKYYHSETTSVCNDIQNIFKRFDVIGKDYKKWLKTKNQIIAYSKSKRGYDLCKAYIPIFSRNQNALHGARLFLALDEESNPQKIHLVAIIPKSKIAKGSKGDMPIKERSKLFKDYQ